ncbi:hypothetical protein C3Y87_17455 [Carbonactinospora thermoautotrophica]|uniref:hypothetical protein n=1 Tax=Carbonactinospora thermoautotrophica TaxID=1469144 RepID=UPI00226E85ED|nr:hypothetical protein [Carbonactinospora thermoautotrophica]MCX9193159.1 hypothetical protein [Carbonactinospora thermoautotrophica]
MTAHTDWQRWCDRFDKIHNGVIRLFRDRAIWRTILAMLDANPDAAPGPSRVAVYCPRRTAEAVGGG